jgi:hypothetical protein
LAQADLEQEATENDGRAVEIDGENNQNVEKIE